MRRLSGALLVLAVLAGCGGESSSERIRKAASATATPVADTRSDDDGAGGTVPLDVYRLRADKLCETVAIRGSARLAPLQAKVREKPTLARVMKLNAAAAEFVEPLFEELAALPRPKGREQEVRRMTRLGAATIRYLKRTVRAYEAGHVSAAKRALRVNVTAASAYAEAARRLGLEECGSQYVYPGR
jgi:hypothetical protein